jgi:glutamate formiminotransferase
VLECVVNVSEGRDMARLRALADASSTALLDVHADADHHRSVFTLAAREVAALERATCSLASRVAELVSISEHRGEHPRLGALDVVPFVAVSETADEFAIAADAARTFGKWWAETYDVPVFLYDDADPERRDLPSVRRGAFQSRPPDYGPETPHPQLGATAVGARRPLVAVNCVLAAHDVEVARRIARRVRELSGGLPGVRALGFILATQGHAQVSMNLVDLHRTGVEEACGRVRQLAHEESTGVVALELVGLVPGSELDRWSADFRRWSQLDAASTIEARIDEGPRWLPGHPPLSKAAPPS